MSDRNFALHVGIDRYPSFGGAADLPGAARDADRWRAWSTGPLGAPAANVTVLTDAAASREALVAALRALGAAVGATGSGLVTFSGHGAAAEGTGAVGARIDGSAALAPSDVSLVDGAVRGLLSLAEVEAALGAGAANTTIVVDACYTRLPRTDVAAAPGQDSAARVILGAEPWSEAWEVVADGAWRGAFTFALLTVLEQWTVRESGGVAWANVSAGDLAYRARTLLDALGVPQRPVLAGPPRVALIPFLRPGLEVVEDTSPTPDRPRVGSQLSVGDQGSGYRILRLEGKWGTTWQSIATAILVAKANTAHGYPTADREYWSTPTFTPPSGSLTHYRLTIEVEQATWVDYASDASTYGVSPSGAPCDSGQTFARKSTVSPWPPTGYSTIRTMATPGANEPRGLAVALSGTGAQVLTGILWIRNVDGSFGGFLGNKPGGYTATFAASYDPVDYNGVFIQTMS